jgi:hypothetical protein
VPKSIFLHLPKTGGTTLRDVIVRQFRGRTAFRFDGSERERAHFAGLAQSERDRFDLVEGHLHYGVHRLLSGPSAYITMLREPVDRVLSFYWFVLATPTHYMHKRFHELGTLRAAIERTSNPELDNFQVRLLSGEASLGVPHGRVDRAMLDAAKANLGQCAVVGLTDRFDESLALLAVRFGWTDLTYHRFKKAINRPTTAELEPEVVDLVRRTNSLDIELYDHARVLFDQQLPGTGLAFERALERVRRDQETYESAGHPPPPEPSLVGGIWRL